MKKRILQIIQYSVFFLVGIFLVWWSLHQLPDTEFEQFKQSLTHARYWMIIPVFIILTTSHILRALRWKILMEPMGYKPSLVNCFFAVMIGYLANMAVPRLGEVLKCTILAKYEKVPAQKIVGTIVAERAFDVLCLGIVFLLALFFQFDVVQSSYHNVKAFASSHKQTEGSNLKLIILYAITVCIGVLFIWLMVSKKLGMISSKVKQILLGVWEGLMSAGKLKQKYTFIFYSASIWILYVLGTWIGLYATSGTELGIKAAISCLAFASIGMILTPGGIGAYAYLLAKVLEDNDVPYAIGIANGTLQWFAQCFIVLLVGSVCLGLLPFYNKKHVPQS